MHFHRTIMISLQRTHYYSVNEYHQNVFVHVANQCLSSLKDHVHVHQIPKTQCQIAKLNLKIAKLIPEKLSKVDSVIIYFVKTSPWLTQRMLFM